MDLLSSAENIHNSKFFFSRNELTKILAYYSIGVSKGNWKDYAIHNNINEASFYMFKHSLDSPYCILSKTNKFNNKSLIFNLQFKNKIKSRFDKIDDIISVLKRNELKII
jgi:hypothetical protein